MRFDFFSNFTTKHLGYYTEIRAKSHLVLGNWSSCFIVVNIFLNLGFEQINFAISHFFPIECITTKIFVGNFQYVPWYLGYLHALSVYTCHKWHIEWYCSFQRLTKRWSVHTGTTKIVSNTLWKSQNVYNYYCTCHTYFLSPKYPLKAKVYVWCPSTIQLQGLEAINWN